MNKAKIIKGLELICSTSITNQKKTEEFISYSWWSKEGISVFISGNEYKEFHKIITILLSSVEIKNNFQRKDIENSLKEVISRVLKIKSEKARKKRVRKEVDNLLNKIKDSIKDWVFIIPIENLHLDKHSIKVGDIIFQKMTKNKISNLHREHKKIIFTLKNLNEKSKKKFANNEKKNMKDY